MSLSSVSSTPITLDTLVLVGTALTMLVGMILTAAKVMTSLESIRKDIETLKEDGYTKAAASEHALRLKIHNPGMRVPDPRNPDLLIGDHPHPP